MNKIIFFILFSILLTSCSIGDNFSVGEPEDVQLGGIQGNAVTMTMAMPITNNNWFRVKVREINLEARIDGKYLGSVTNKEPLIITGNSKNVHEVELQLEVKNILLGASTLFKLTQQNRQKPKLSLEGEIITTGIFIRKKIPVSESDLLRYMN